MDNSIVLAALGGLAVNVLDLMELRNVPRERWPDFKSVVYWLPFVLWPLLGAFVAYVYQQSGTELNPVLAVNIGASAPLILRGMAAANPTARQRIDPGPGA